MPELPDVETFRRYLGRTALHRRVEGVSQLSERMLQSVSPATLRKRLRHRVLEEARRHGKHLFVRLDDAGGWLVLHFGMTGFLSYYRDTEQAPRHPRLTLDLDNGDHLSFDCQRMFGEIDWTRDDQAYIRERELGPDALGLTQKQFLQRLSEKRGSVKAALMDQSLLAGIGNVYSDEMLFHACVHPKTSVGDLDDAARKELYRTMKRVLKDAIQAKADPEKVPDAWLLPHRAEGERCPRCGTELKKQRVSSRSAWWCPRCQGG